MFDLSFLIRILIRHQLLFFRAVHVWFFRLQRDTVLFLFFRVCVCAYILSIFFKKCVSSEARILFVCSRDNTKYVYDFFFLALVY